MPRPNAQDPARYSAVSTGNGDVSPGVSFLSTSATGGGGGGGGGGGVEAVYTVTNALIVFRYPKVEFIKDIYEVPNSVIV